jgi:hypothetical protein
MLDRARRLTEGLGTIVPTSKRERHAARMRRHRARQASGQVSVTTDFSPQEVHRLCSLGYLRESELEDRARIAAAIHALLANIVTDEM